MTRNQRALVKELLFSAIMIGFVVWLFVPYFNGGFHIKRALGL